MSESRGPTLYDIRGKRIYVAGHRGMVGAALTRRLEREDCTILTVSRSQVDLRDQVQVRSYFSGARPDVVVVAAARVGGILANATHPAEFLYENLMIAANVTHAAWEAGVEKMLYLGSTCIYPKFAPQPIDESALLTGPLEPTNEGYALAKIAGMKLAQFYRRQHGCDFISALPTNLYGPGDNFDLATGHVLPALIRKAHEAKSGGSGVLTVWGTGTPRREFLHVDDCADALVHLLKVYSDDEHVNVGCGADLTIAELAHLVAGVVGFTGSIRFDAAKPDGTPRKLTSVEKLTALGWRPRIALREGIEDTYRAFLKQYSPA
jgi:GDP-L-fucose synthase